MLDDDQVDDEGIEDEELEKDTKEDSQIENLKQQAKDFEDKWKRALADYQNLERRTAEIRKEWITESNRDLILKLFPVLDTLILAQAHVKDEGLRLSIQKFLDILKDEGVIKIPTDGEKFDPHLMEATEVVDGPENKVVEEVRSGFMLNDKVLRPAQVKVGKGK
jgi:molecular chaperone GrpE